MCVCSPSESLEQRGPGALQCRERPERPCARGQAQHPPGRAWSRHSTGLDSLCSAQGSLSRCRWQPCLPSSAFPASSQPPNKGLRRCMRSSSLLSSSNCHVEEREGGRLLLSARLSQSKFPAEQLKIDGQLVVRAGTSPESMASVSQECCLVIRLDKLGLELRLCGRQAAVGMGSRLGCQQGWRAPVLWQLLGNGSRTVQVTAWLCPCCPGLPCEATCSGTSNN